MTSEMPIIPAVRARRHGLADLLARSAVRTWTRPRSSTATYGSPMPTWTRWFPDRRRSRRPRRRQGRPDRPARPELARLRGRVLRARPPRRRVGSGELHAHRPEVAYVLTHAGATGVIAGADLTGIADAALAEAGLEPGSLKVHAVIGGDPVDGWEPFSDLGASDAPGVRTSIWTTTTPSRSCTPPAPNPAPRAP
ncbi:hypothetical protein ACU686_23685 [Yinghuangia aomiensis]